MTATGIWGNGWPRVRPYEYGGREFRIFRAPGYPSVLAGLFWCAGVDVPVIWARGVGAGLGTLAVVGVMWLGSMMFDGRTGVVAGSLAAIYPGAIGMSIFVLAEALFCPLMVLHLVCWAGATRQVSQRGQAMWGIVAGVAGGLAILTRPSWLLFLPFAWGLVLLFGTDRRRHAWIGLCMAGAICVTMFPWWVRNYRAVGQFVPTTLQVGASLYDGLNPVATGASNMDFSKSFYQAQKADDAACGRTWDAFEVRLDRRMRDAAIVWAKAHPGEVVRLMGSKFLRMWNLWPNATEFRSPWMQLIVAAGFVPLLVLGIAGAWRWGRRGWPYVLCLLPAVYFTCLHMVFVSSLRYRQPAMLVWLILAAAMISPWIYRAGASETESAAATR